MSEGPSVLIIGGYGTFGGRIVQLLENEPRLTLIVAGRSRVAAEAFCRDRDKAKARLVPAVFDRSGDVAAQLATLRPDIVVDASGPFQAYGGEAYRVIGACVARRIDYLDLADGSDFVDGVRAFDAEARAAGISVLSGVSSFPVLTAAVVRRLSRDMTRVVPSGPASLPRPMPGSAST
jgi:saccharopine dehydrogenase-like NADP-dependent oxidoreductase